MQAETGRISIDFSERFENRATTKAAELVRGGAIGQVVNTIGTGPHLARLETRPPWFFERCPIRRRHHRHRLASIRPVPLRDRGEAGTDCRRQVANYNHPEHPELEDFGHVMLSAENCTGYIRVDWFTPDGLPTWGDGRLFVVGTEGTIEVRKYLDIAGRPGADHLFLVDQKGVQHIDCSGVELPYGRQLVYDILHRTESAMSQEHCFYASELALRAQKMAARLGYLAE